MNKEQKPNQLVYESSPYLLQHAYNPVNWFPWGKVAIQKALEEDKPIILSIGYSSCHWCHVMERESFENGAIAAFMNEHFVCIKVDREERPDIDQVYMDAVQAMGVNGGWPLNVFLTPEQKPFYGGTYFPPQSWLKLLYSLRGTWIEKREEVNLSSERLTNHIAKSDLKKYGLSDDQEEFSGDRLKTAITQIHAKFDYEWGGLQKSPKFPMPSIWNFLLQYATLSDNKNIENHVIFTLDHIASGGIYDHIGGGFARYSVDEKWFVPHFEKMLYDNGQLISLYAQAYSKTGNRRFRDVIDHTIQFLTRELQSPDQGYFCALDADSEGVEGKYYTWHEEEFRNIVKVNPQVWLNYYHITKTGNWEDGLNIPFTNSDDSGFIDKNKLTAEEFYKQNTNVRLKLLNARESRTRPGLDNKIIASWNAILLNGLLDAYSALGQPTYLQLGKKLAHYLQDSHIKEDRIFRIPIKEKSAIGGFLEDYAFVIQSFIKLYETTFDEQWLKKALQLAQYCLTNFYDPEECSFYFTDKNDEALIAVKKEIFDNVIPSSNSVMAMNLLKLSIILDKIDFFDIASSMVRKVSGFIQSDLEYMSNWGRVYLMLSNPPAEIVISGPKALAFRDHLATRYIPNKIFIGTENNSELPILQGRTALEKTRIFICRNKTCHLPVESVNEAMKQLGLDQ